MRSVSAAESGFSPSTTKVSTGKRTSAGANWAAEGSDTIAASAKAAPASRFDIRARRLFGVSWSGFKMPASYRQLSAAYRSLFFLRVVFLHPLRDFSARLFLVLQRHDVVGGD